MIDVIERLQKAETRPLDADGKTQLWETLQDARAEIARLRLTDAEREAVNDAIYLCEAEAGLFGERAAATKWATCAATLRGVSERMGGER